MARKSTKQLKADVATLKAAGVKIGGMEEEVYGRDARWYINCRSQKNRRVVEAHLRDLGHHICEDYWPGGTVAEIGVTYFKGFHWDE